MINGCTQPLTTSVLSFIFSEKWQKRITNPASVCQLMSTTVSTTATAWALYTVPNERNSGISFFNEPYWEKYNQVYILYCILWDRNVRQYNNYWLQIEFAWGGKEEKEEIKGTKQLTIPL